MLFFVNKMFSVKHFLILIFFRLFEQWQENYFKLLVFTYKLANTCVGRNNLFTDFIATKVKLFFKFCGDRAEYHRKCSVKKNVLRNFTKFTGKYLCQSLFFK